MASAQKLYKNLDPIKKSQILNFAPLRIPLAEKYANSEAIFVPEINENSEKIIQKLDLYSVRVEDRLTYLDKQKNQKLKELQLIQMNKELKECSFKP